MKGKVELFLLYKGAEKFLEGHGYLKHHGTKVLTSFFRSILKPDFVEVEGHKIFLDDKDSLRLSINGSFEEFETETLKKIIKEGDVVIDIGANIGYYTLLFAKLVGGKGKVFAFEPDPDNFQLLKKNVEINGYQNVVLERKALSNKNGKTKLYLCDFNRGAHRIFESELCKKSIEIETVRLDDYFSKLHLNEPISFIKMDTEGSELGVIEGMRSILQENKDMKIMTEFAPFSIKEYGRKPEELMNVLTENGFKLYVLHKRNKKVEIADVKKLLIGYHPKGRRYVLNLLCVRENLISVS